MIEESSASQKSKSCHLGHAPLLFCNHPEHLEMDFFFNFWHQKWIWLFHEMAFQPNLRLSSALLSLASSRTAKISGPFLAPGCEALWQTHSGFHILDLCHFDKILDWVLHMLENFLTSPPSCCHQETWHLGRPPPLHSSGERIRLSHSTLRAW